MTDKNQGIDLLGIKPISESINTVTQGVIDGASSFLGKICLPAAEEFGLLLRDRVSGWRAKNAVAIAIKAQELLSKQMEHTILSAHPRIIYESIEKGSWAENPTMQNLWAGLLASSCTRDGKDESNLIFITILSQMTSSQGVMLKYACETAKIGKSSAGWIIAEHFELEADFLKAITGISDLHQIDHELDHLRALELINGGFDPDSTIATVTPTALALQLYARCQGYVGSPLDYYEIVEIDETILVKKFEKKFDLDSEKLF